MIRSRHSGAHLCTLCNGPGHVVTTCPEFIGPRPITSKSERAAWVCVTERVTYRDAAKRFKISHQAVHQAYAKLFPGEPPPVGKSLGDVAARELVIELARGGRPDREIAAEVGFCLGHVRHLLAESGIQTNGMKKSAAMAAAIEAVRAGATIVEACSDHGVSYGRLRERCRAVGITATDKPGPRNGSAVAAADLVRDERLTVPDAARRMRCAPAAVHGVLARRAS